MKRTRGTTKRKISTLARRSPRRTASAPTDRRAQILDAAMSEFAELGYRAASTNTIAARAGVAKGLLFHYFGDKDALFLAVVAELAKVIGPAFDGILANAPRDLIGRILVVTERKVAFVHEWPRESRFLLVGLADAPAHIAKQARALLEPAAGAIWKQIFDDLDTSTLRPGVSVQEAVELVQLFSAGLERRNQALVDSVGKAKAFDVDAVVAHGRRMLQLLRDGLYR